MTLGGGMNPELGEKDVFLGLILLFIEDEGARG